MSRLARKNRTDIEYKGCGGLFDLFDDQMKSSLRINDKEFDYILEKAIEKEDAGDGSLMNLLVNEKLTFTQKKELLINLDKFIEELNSAE